MATMVELAQRMLTNRPTVALISGTAIWLVASSPTRASDPRTEITRPKDATALEPYMVSISRARLSCPDYAGQSLEKRLNRGG